MSSTPNLPVLIIGAGLAGLTLARALAKSNIPAIIFEASAKGRSPGYGLTLKSTAYLPLLELLGIGEDSFRKAVGVDSAFGGKGHVQKDVSINPRSGKLGRLKGREGDSLLLRANKRRLRDLLAKGIDIRWEHKFKRSTSAGKTVLASFENGEAVEGALLVAADGVHSRVRQQVLPGVKPNILGYAVINGQRKVSKEDFQSIFFPVLSKTTAITATLEGVCLGVSINDSSEDIVNISWTYSRPARETDPLFKPDRPVDEAKSIPEEFYEELDQLGELAEPFMEVFKADKAREDKLYSWLMRSITLSKENLETLPANVVLVGDAAHAMPIVVGVGGNHSILDGLTLGSALSGGNHEGSASFSKKQLSRWRQGVVESEENLQSIHIPSTDTVEHL